MKLVRKIIEIFRLGSKINKIYEQNDEIKMLISKNNINYNKKINSENITDYEFKVFSQWGEDGIINFLINNLKIKNKNFVEFGVSDYKESNTRFLLKNDNWSGLVIDSLNLNIDIIKKDPIYWKHDLTAICEFINKKNINNILQSNLNSRDIGLLSIDIDGNDYWIWEEINFVNPSIVIIEYNSLLGSDKSYVVPYMENFIRVKAHYSSIYYGTSLPALVKLGIKKGYSLVGCNSAGNNAFFVKKELINEKVKEKSIEEVFVQRKFRESRDKNNKLSFLNKAEEKEIISKLPLEEV